MTLFLLSLYLFLFTIKPSRKEFKNLFLPEENFYDELDYLWIQQKIDYVNTKYTNEYINVLFILDDVIAKLHKNPRCKEIMTFIFNRRHLLNNGMISILITTQKYRMAPTVIRSNIVFLISFKLNKIDNKIIKDELIYSDVNFDHILNFVFSDEDKDNFLIYRLDNDHFYKKFDKINL